MFIRTSTSCVFLWQIACLTKYSGSPSLNNFVSNFPSRRAPPRRHSLYGGIQFSTVMMLPEETRAFGGGTPHSSVLAFGRVIFVSAMKNT